MASLPISVVTSEALIIAAAHLIALIPCYPLSFWTIRQQSGAQLAALPGCFVEAFGWTIFWKGLSQQLVEVPLLGLRAWLTLRDPADESLLHFLALVACKVLLFHRWDARRILAQTEDVPGKPARPHPWSRGLLLTLAENLLLYSIYLLLFETLIPFTSPLYKKALLGAVCLAVAATLSNPISLLRLRLLLRNSSYPTNILQLVRRVAEEDGLASMFLSGLLPRLLYHLGLYMHVLAWAHGLFLSLGIPSSVPEAKNVPLTALVHYLL